MAKISKDAARKAAEQIAAPLKQKADTANNNLKSFLIKIYLDTLPKQVVDTSEKYYNYVQRSWSVRVYGIGINGDWIGLGEGVPAEHGNTPILKLDEKEAKEYLKLDDIRATAQEKYKQTLQEVENTILTLGTHKKIAEVIPNALRFLPEINKPSRELVLQIQPIVDKVNCLITNEDKCVDKL